MVLINESFSSGRTDDKVDGDGRVRGWDVDVDDDKFLIGADINYLLDRKHQANCSWTSVSVSVLIRKPDLILFWVNCGPSSELLLVDKHDHRVMENDVRFLPRSL